MRSRRNAAENQARLDSEGLGRAWQRQSGERSRSFSLNAMEEDTADSRIPRSCRDSRAIPQSLDRFLTV